MVFVPSLDSDMMPFKRSVKEDEQDGTTVRTDEERRLLYVSMHDVFTWLFLF